MLLPMFDFPNINGFIIAMPLMGCIGDIQFTHIARRWPLLTDLRLCDEWGWSRPSDITLAAVAFVAWQCPQLISLSIAVNATIDNVAMVTSQPGFKANKSLRFFNAMDSIMGDPAVFARAVHAFAPITSQVIGIGWCELDEDNKEIPPEQDPMGFFQTVTDFVHAMREKEEGKAHEKSAEDWAAAELEGLNPWAPDAKVELWAQEKTRWIPADEWAPYES